MQRRTFISSMAAGAAPVVAAMARARQPRRRPPLLGEHAEEVLAEIGIRGEALAQLRAGGALGA